jgi:DNA-binding transcriptional regulator YiaG
MSAMNLLIGAAGSRPAVARRLGVSVSTVTRWANCHGTPTDAQLAQLYTMVWGRRGGEVRP